MHDATLLGGDGGSEGEEALRSNLGSSCSNAARGEDVAGSAQLRVVLRRAASLFLASAADRGPVTMDMRPRRGGQYDLEA